MQGKIHHNTKNALPKDIEEKLARLVSFTDLNPRPIVEIDTKGVVTYANKAAMAQIPRLAKQGKNHPYLADVQIIIQKLKREKSLNIIREIKVKNDWFRQAFYYIPQFKSIRIYSANITEQKNAEFALREKEKNMQEERNNFIAILSHELRNPLTPILANAQFIGAMIGKGNSALEKNMREAAEIIEKQAKIMAGLLNDILDVSRLARHKIQLEKKKMDLCEAIKNSVQASMPFINVKNQTISVYFDHKPMHITADPLRIEQIMINLINNASKYTPEKGRIQVRCTTKNSPTGEHVEISVKDNGMGMDRKKISRIFDLFAGEGQPFMGVGGLGIGLNIVKNLVQMHGGTVRVTSRGENKGSEFIVVLPALNKNADARVSQKFKKKTGHKLAGSLSRVLIVDDNKDIRETISKILRHKGHPIKSTSHGWQALKISKTFKPNVALIDIGLPDINGYKVAKMLKEQYENAGAKIRLIAFTGYGQEKDKQRAALAGFDAHLTKPVDIGSLVKMVS